MKNNAAGMSLIVKTITRLTSGLVLVYGVYLTLHGDTGPGGGFAGGIIIALSFVYLMLAFGRDVVVRRINLYRGIYISAFASSALIIAVISTVRNRGEWFSASAEVVAAMVVLASVLAMFFGLVMLTGENRKK